MSAADSLGLSHARIMAHGYCDCIKLLVGSCASPLDQGAQGTCAVHSVAHIHEPRIASMCHLPAKGRRHVAQPPTALRSLYRPNALWACMIAKQSKAKCVSCRIGISFEFIAAAASADSYPRQAAMPWRNWKRRRRLTMPWQGWKQQLPQACPRYSQKTTHVRRNYAVSRDCYTAHLSEDQKLPHWNQFRIHCRRGLGRRAPAPPDFDALQRHRGEPRTHRGPWILRLHQALGGQS